VPADSKVIEFADKPDPNYDIDETKMLLSDFTYDVKSSDSLITPYVGHITCKAVRTRFMKPSDSATGIDHVNEWNILAKFVYRKNNWEMQHIEICMLKPSKWDGYDVLSDKETSFVASSRRSGGYSIASAIRCTYHAACCAESAPSRNRSFSVQPST
jgi:hypothetical protein